jgi:hypothetical protein
MSANGTSSLVLPPNVDAGTFHTAWKEFTAIVGTEHAELNDGVYPLGSYEDPAKHHDMCVYSIPIVQAFLTVTLTLQVPRL